MMFAYFWLLCVVAVYSSPIDPPPDEFIDPSATRALTRYRIPDGLVEANDYIVELRLPADIFENHIFQGDSTVNFVNLQSTRQVPIQANELNFTQITMTDSSGNEIEFEQTDYVIDAETDMLNLTTTTDLVVNGVYSIHFVYTGRLRTGNQMNGLYRSSYVNEAGETRYLATTQFQPVSARKVFPCFDEPLYKAEFDISIRHQTQYTAISNTQETKVVDPDDPDFSLTTFARTPRMSTYLIALIISDFSCSQSTELIENTIPHSICSRTEAAPTRALANEYGPKLTAAMQSFTGVPYSTSTITKIHQFAIPDFSAGAMENWGIVTYRERYILWDPLHSSNRYKQNVITIVAHELAHFWFGNLVTCRWWSDTFLNEGFATYFEYHATYDVEPALETDKQFVIEQLQPVLVSDASRNSAPLSSAASSPSEISGRFSSISYNKGGSIFRMVQHFMGLDNFKQGLNLYMNTNQFQNSVPTLLWTALQTYTGSVLPAGQTLSTVMSNWVTRAGYPLLTVTRNGLGITVTQQRFLSDPNAVVDPEEVWYVPVSYTTSANSSKFQDTSAHFWLPPTGNAAIASVLENEDAWIILNNQQTGYYRVDYDTALWENIKTALNTAGFDGIHELNRAQIVDDYWNFVRYGYKPLTELLDLYQYLQRDSSYYPWYAALTAFNNILLRVANQQTRTLISSHLLELLEVVYNSVPFDVAKEDDHIYTLKKVLVVPWACRLGLKDCVDHSIAAFNDYRSTGTKPDKNLRSVIYCNGLRHSTGITADWDFLWSEYVATKQSDEQVTILSALGCATDATVLKNYLTKTLSPSGGIREQDTSAVFSAVIGGNPENVDVLLEWLIENYRQVDDVLGSLTTQLNNAASRFTTEEQIEQLRQFMQGADLTAAQTTAITNTINNAVTNLELTARYEEELTFHFESQAQPDTADRLRIGLATMATTLLVLLYQLAN